MAAKAEVQIRPKDGKWSWERKEGSKVVDSGEARDRVKAVRDARKAAGVEETRLFTENGDEYGVARTKANCRVVLLREDGSEYGELDPGPSEATGPAQKVSITPATEQSGANGLGGGE